MKSSHLIVMPLLALVFILFLYWLAVQNAPPKSMRKTPIAIAALEIVAADDSKTRELVLAGRFDRSSASAATTGTDDSVRKVTNLETAMYNAKPFVTEQDTFLPSDRIYIVLELHDLDKGQHRLSASWIDPEGKTINTSGAYDPAGCPRIDAPVLFLAGADEERPFTELVTAGNSRATYMGAGRSRFT